MVGIVLLEYNNSKDTINCIDSILKFNTYPIKFFIVDNASPNKSNVIDITNYIKQKYNDKFQIIKYDGKPSTYLEFNLILNNVNLGYANGNNAGLNHLYNDKDIEYVLILNPDIIFIEDIIGRLVFDYKNLKSVGIVSPLLYKNGKCCIDFNCARKQPTVNNLILSKIPFDPFKTKTQNKILINLNLKIIPIELPSGSCMLLSKTLMNKLGGFDRNTFLYFEENILFEKIKILGLQNYLDLTIHCIHVGGTTTNQIKSLTIIRHDIRSTKYFINTYKKPNIIQKFFLNLTCSLKIIYYYLLNLIR